MLTENAKYRNYHLFDNKTNKINLFNEFMNNIINRKKQKRNI